jgi:hypothetical protein
MKMTSYYEIDLGLASTLAIPVPLNANYGSFQALSLGADPTTMSLAVRRSLGADPASAVEFGTPVAVDPSTRAIVGPVDLRDTGHLFIRPASTQAGKRCRLVVLFTDRE